MGSEAAVDDVVGGLAEAATGPSVPPRSRLSAGVSREGAKARNEVWGLRLRVGNSQQRHDPANKAPPPPDLVLLRSEHRDERRSAFRDRTMPQSVLTNRRTRKAQSAQNTDLRTLCIPCTPWSEFRSVEPQIARSARNIGLRTLCIRCTLWSKLRPVEPQIARSAQSNGLRALCG